MTVHPIDTEALRDAVRDHEPDDHGPGKCGLDDCFTSCVECGEDWPCLWSSLPEVLAAAEHRATRAEAQSAIRGRAVVMYRERAREAEARIAAVDAELLYAELHGNPEVWTHNIRRALDGEA